MEFGTYFVRAEDKPATPVTGAAPQSFPSPTPTGFIEMFNGKDLTGWSGYEGYWSAKDGAIVGSEEKAKSKHTFLVYTAIPTIGDFEMHYKYKFGTPTGNSGLQFRSKIYDAKNFSRRRIPSRLRRRQRLRRHHLRRSTASPADAER